MSKDPQQYLKAIIAGGTAFGGVYAGVISDGLVSQQEWTVVIVTTLVAVLAVYLVPNRNEDGSWGSQPDLSGALEQVTALAGKVSAIVAALAGAGVLKASDPVVAATPELADEVAAVAVTPSVESPVDIPEVTGSDIPADIPEPGQAAEVSENTASYQDEPASTGEPQYIEHSGSTPVGRFDEPVDIFDDYSAPAKES